MKPNDLYVVQAILTDGDRHYAMPIQAPVLAKGSKNDGVSIELVAEQTPGEKLLADFKTEQDQLGAMYKDGKPWFIVQQTKPSRDGKPTSIDRAGWSDDGTLVVKQHQVGSDVQPLDAGDADKLKQQAMTILGLATNGKNK